MTARREDAQAQILTALQAVFGSLLHSAILKGSALRGDFIPYYSDLDIHAFLHPDALMDTGTPRLDLALRFQQRIGKLDPEYYGCSEFQIIFLPLEYPVDWGKPGPGAYQVLCGDPSPILGDLSHAALEEQARRRLDRLAPDLHALIRSFIDKPDTALLRQSRAIGACLKGSACNAAAVLSRDPLAVWGFSRKEILRVLAPIESAGLQAFFAGVAAWPERRGEIGYHRALATDGLQAMADLVAWWSRMKRPT